MSVRTSTTGPGPFFSTPTTPVPPTFSVTSKPAFRNSSASLAAVFTSIKDSSGWAWMCLYSATRSGSSASSVRPTASVRSFKPGVGGGFFSGSAEYAAAGASKGMAAKANAKTRG